MTNPNWITLNDEAVEAIHKTIKEAITQGEIMLRAGCPRKWFYRYALKLGRRGFLDFNLVYGSLLHSLLETLYKEELQSFTPQEEPVKITKSMVVDAVGDAILRPQDLAELELIKAKVQIHFDAYRMHWHRLDAKLQIEGVEQILDFRFNNLNLTGKLDLIARPHRRDGIFIWDFKSAGQLDATALDAWTFKFQFHFYCWLYWKATGRKPTGIMINGLVKSHLRPRQADRKTKKLETQEQYLFRVKGDMAANREKYFYRQRIPLGTDALERFEAEVLMPHMDAFNLLGSATNGMILRALGLKMNTNHCHVYNSYCEYLSLCKDGRMAEREFDQREVKHEEINVD